MSIISPFQKLFDWQTAHDRINKTAPLSGAGTPTVTATVPQSIGQIYVDTAASKVYVAEGITDVSDWLILN